VKFPSSVSDLGIYTARPTFWFIFPVALAKAIEGVVLHVVDMLKDSDSWVRHSAVTAISEILKQSKWFSHLHIQAHLLSFFFPAELVEAMENAVPYVIELLKDNNLRNDPSAVAALSNLSKLRKCYLHGLAHLLILSSSGTCQGNWGCGAAHCWYAQGQQSMCSCFCCDCPWWNFKAV